MMQSLELSSGLQSGQTQVSHKKQKSLGSNAQQSKVALYEPAFSHSVAVIYTQSPLAIIASLQLNRMAMSDGWFVSITLAIATEGELTTVNWQIVACMSDKLLSRS